MTAGAAVQKLMMKIENEQEVLMNLADMAIETFNAESVLLRVMKMTDQHGEANTQLYRDMMRTYLYDAADKVNKSGKDQFDRDHIRMMEWLRKHYQTVYYHALKGDVNDELFSYLFMKRKKMIVMGAYGRPLLSNLFKKSSADKLIHMLDLPLFITHH